MDDQDFQDIVAGLDVPADEPASAATDEASPELDSTPAAEAAQGVAPQSAPEQDAAEPESTAQQPAGNPWARADNPYYQQAIAAQQQQAYIAQMQAAQQQQQYEYQLQMQAAQDEEYLREIAGGDVETYDRLRAVVANRVTPAAMQAQQMFQEAEYTRRLATAIHIAASSMVPAEYQQNLTYEIQRLMTMNDPQQMLGDVQYRQAAAQQYQQQLSAAQQELNELKRVLGARAGVLERVSRGADLVDGATGVAGNAVSRNSDDFDTWFDDLLSGNAA